MIVEWVMSRTFAELGRMWDSRTVMENLKSITSLSNNFKGDLVWGIAVNATKLCRVAVTIDESTVEEVGVAPNQE